MRLSISPQMHLQKPGMPVQRSCPSAFMHRSIHVQPQLSASKQVLCRSTGVRPPHILTDEEAKRKEPTAGEKEECTALRNHSTRPVIATQGFGVTDTNGPLSMEVTEESELAQLKQLQALTRSQQRQILEHQEALASLHAMIRETQEAQGVSISRAELPDTWIPVQHMAAQQHTDGQSTTFNGVVRQTQQAQLQQSAVKQSVKQNGAARQLRPFDAQLQMADRRSIGLYDARFHSTSWGATPKDHRVLPKRIILVRHAESQGNIDHFAYSEVPDPQICLTDRGIEQAQEAGEKIKKLMDSDGNPYKLYFYMSPYRRSSQTTEAIASVFQEDEISGFQEEVQLREQDFGNFQDQEGKKHEKAERMRYGRFFYRFPNGESGADVYDRMTIFEDHLVRDINAGRYSKHTSLVLVTHGLAARIFLMRWFHWTVEQFMEVYNPPNAEPVVLERVPSDEASKPGGGCTWIHTKALYRLTKEAKQIMKGCSDDMCSTSAMLTGVRVSDWIEED